MKRWNWLDSLILSLGVFLRCLKMTWPLTGDECCTFLWYARQPVEFIVSTYNTPNNHILHSILMHLCYVIFGPNEIALRLPVFLAGVGCIVLAWALALHLTGDIAIARLTALFVALSRHMVNYSQSGRGYAIATFLSLALALYILSDWSKEHRAAWIGAAALGFLVLYTIPSGIIFLIPFYAFVLWQLPDAMGGRWSVALAGILTVLLAAAGYSPLFNDLIAFSHGQQTAIIQTDVIAFVAEVYSEACAGLTYPVQFSVVLVFGYLAARNEVGSVLFLVLMLLGYLVPALLLHRWFPFLLFYPRNFDIIYPIFYTACAGGIVWSLRAISDIRITAFCVCGMVAVASVAVTETIQESLAPTNLTYRIQQDGRTIARKYAGQLRPTEYMRGSPILDGVALFEFVEHARQAKLMQEISKVYFFSESRKEMEAFRDQYPGLKDKALERQGAVVVYRLGRS